ncbi:hypothetical protein BGZ80_007603 [Entomortierella chlamydospora]|uniref:AD domain-containing protein n=1 Tax=Entomortierella chlamydospora TaxID=101097 RepID=A0A9P6MXZ4_9FUNG|nr:hypothetical protein BGZ79_000935 [Entomortierella chlamydospora]KAG0018063.1 hypothetical protein BGZ80_007603 [Entomortierella chlamydospora]
MAKQWLFFGYTLGDIHSQLGSVCRATLLNGMEYSGYLYSVDPETYTLLMLLRGKKGSSHEQSQSQHESGASWTMVAVRQHALTAWECPDDSSSDRLSLEEMDTLAHIPIKLGDEAEIKSRKERLVTFLRSKRIPVESTTEDKVVHIMNCAHVQPPYLAASVDCTNVVICERIKRMIEEMQ